MNLYVEKKSEYGQFLFQLSTGRDLNAVRFNTNMNTDTLVSGIQYGYEDEDFLSGKFYLIMDYLVNSDSGHSKEEQGSPNLKFKIVE